MISKSAQVSHKRLLTRLTLSLHLIIAIVLIIASNLPSFDSSASLVLDNASLTSLLRWDVFHYAHVAQSGYVYEHEYAFFPGTPTIMRLFSRLTQLAGVPVSGFEAASLAGPFVSAIVGVDAVHTLYDLSLHHLRSPHTALLVSILSLLSSSPATLRFAPYAEPFFTYLSYKGMLRCSQERFVEASVMFSLASFFRSNGTILSGYIIWGMLIGPILYGSSLSFGIRSQLRFLPKALGCLILSALPLLPLLWHQYNGYLKFCGGPHVEPRRPWCEKRIPLIYSFVQSEYWDVGLFRYWTIQQVPNVLLAAPVLALLLHGSIGHIRETAFPRVLGLLKGDAKDSYPATGELRANPLFNPSVTPHAIHALILSVVFLTSVHTQIALRLASALPFTYWAAAHLFLDKPHFRRGTDKFDSTRKRGESAQKRECGESSRASHWWVGWSVLWGTISLVTWAMFLPPA